MQHLYVPLFQKEAEMENLVQSQYWSSPETLFFYSEFRSTVHMCTRGSTTYEQPAVRLADALVNSQDCLHSLLWTYETYKNHNTWIY